MKTKLLKISTLLMAIILLFTSFTACSKEEFEGISLTDVTVTYSQSGHNVIVAGLENYPDATYTLSEEKIDVGVYTQKLTVSQEGYNDLELTATLTIKKAMPVNLYPETVGPSFYNEGVLRTVWTGSPITVTAFANYEQKDIAIIEYYNGTNKLTAPPTDVGSYVIKISLPETNNYFTLSKDFTLEIIEPSFNATFKVINPLTNEIEETFIGARQYQRNAQINVEDIIFGNFPSYDGYVFSGWFVEDVALHNVFDYNKDITVIGKFINE